MQSAVQLSFPKRVLIGLVNRIATSIAKGFLIPFWGVYTEETGCKFHDYFQSDTWWCRFVRARVYQDKIRADRKNHLSNDNKREPLQEEERYRTVEVI